MAVIRITIPPGSRRGDGARGGRRHGDEITMTVPGRGRSDPRSGAAHARGVLPARARSSIGNRVEGDRRGRSSSSALCLARRRRALPPAQRGSPARLLFADGDPWPPGTPRRRHRQSVSGDRARPQCIKDVPGAAAQVKLMPTGGITLENASNWIGAGAVAVRRRAAAGCAGHRRRPLRHHRQQRARRIVSSVNGADIRPRA